jgi:hypothetical protein
MSSDIEFYYNVRQHAKSLPLGGGRTISHLLTAPLSPHNLVATTIVIVLDLSLPGNILDSLSYWIKTLSE